MSLVEPGVFGYLPYTLAIINTLRRIRADNTTHHNICIVPRQLFGLTALRPHQYMSPDYYYYNVSLGELTTNINSSIIITALAAPHI